MTQRLHAPTTRPWTLPAIAALLLVVLALAKQGQDANWDLRNYHLYTPSALMDGRFDGDIAAAQLQTWHNPALDVPFAWMVKAGLPGWAVSLWLALPAFVAVLFALRLLDLLWPDGRSATRTAMTGLAAVAGAAVMPSIGTTFNDAFVAAGVIAALWWIADSQGRRRAWATWLPAGLMAGLCAGLKLTGALYCVGFIGAALVCGPVRGAPLRILALAVGGIAGVALTAGPWALYLWHEHGNPLFPYFNQWFNSPDALPHAHKDVRFVPQGIDALLVPFHLLVDSSRFSEGKLSDPRVLLGLASLGAWWVSAWRGRRQDGTAMPIVNALVVFAVVSFAVWVKLYGIYRYLFALELVCSIAIFGVVSARVPARHARVAMLALAVLLVAGTNRPNWGRDPFRTPMISVQMPALPEGSLVVLADDDPLAYAVSYLPRTVPAISMHNNFMTPARCTDLQARVEQRVRRHAGPVFLLRKATGSPMSDAILAYGLRAEGACLSAPTSLDELELCPLMRGTPTPTICAATAPGP
ncbi:glycosyltransferase family 87 protein [Pseudoxanthomonas sp.]|uniref:glycosyltransferase family 87 protein n=1 Tax=Pseudoxanthomonas sp. TaxID=1871049 RepID=UPI002FE39606